MERVDGLLQGRHLRLEDLALVFEWQVLFGYAQAIRFRCLLLGFLGLSTPNELETKYTSGAIRVCSYPSSLVLIGGMRWIERIVAWITHALLAENRNIEVLGAVLSAKNQATNATVVLCA